MKSLFRLADVYVLISGGAANRARKSPTLPEDAVSSPVRVENAVMNASTAPTLISSRRMKRQEMCAEEPHQPG